MHALISLLFLLKYLIGPAKSTPIDLKGTDPSVLSLGRFPVGGFTKVVTWKRLHPRHSFITLFVRLLRRSINIFIPASILSQFSHAFFSSLGRSQSTILYNISPADLTGEANSKGSFISAIFLRISLLVTLTIGAGKATSIVSTALFHGTPGSLVSPVFTPIRYLAKLWLVSSTVVGCFPAISSTGVARLWLASCWVVECSSATFSEDVSSFRDGTFECHLCSWNLPSLKIAWAAFFSTTVFTPVIRSST